METSSFLFICILREGGVERRKKDIKISHTPGLMLIAVSCLVFALLSYQPADACAPVPSAVSSSQRLSANSQRSFGQSTLQSSPLELGGGEKVPQVSINHVNDLTCMNFDERCRWRNIEGLLIDELDWYQGSGFLDAMRLQLATGTHVPPDAPYAIVATDRVQPAGSKAVLVSDPIPCQVGPGEMRFRYWSSPEVKITVCTKQLAKLYPDFDYCSPPIETGDPGPAFITIPDLERRAFQIFIRAENFVFEAANLQGGFAIIDDIEYYGELCSDLPGPLADAPPPMPAPPPPPAVSNAPKLLHNLIVTRRPSPAMKTVCHLLNCSFSEDFCALYVRSTEWALANGPIGGIGGDASRTPFNPGGSYAYVVGPQALARFATPPFALDQAVNFLFAYFKSGTNDLFRVLAKRRDRDNELVIFQAPRTFGDSRRWFREIRSLQPGEYEYISFEVTNLSANNVVGVDQLTLLDSDQKPLC